MAYSIGFFSFGTKIIIIAQLFLILLPIIFAVASDCNYKQNLNVGVIYYVYNEEYPGSYAPGKQCRWVAIAPQGYVVETTCQIEIPQSPNCNQDRLLISLTGNPNVENAHTYCGFGNTTQVTEVNNITIELISANDSPGGRFLCTLQAKINEPPSCNCGWKGTRRIVGGIETKENEFPMMVGVINLRNSREGVFCGATIIANRYVLSAAHCYKNRNANEVAILAGAHDLTNVSNAKIYLVDQIISHPLYNPDDPQGLNDLAVMKTQQLIEFNMQVGPACLPFRFYENSFTGDSVELLGWGTTEFTGPKSDVLLKTDVNVLSYEECYQRAKGVATKMCTFKRGHDSCQSDSGGPVLWMDVSTIHVHVVGIVSSGYGCATSRPGVNTRVTSYLNWIASVSLDAEYCVK